jgi:hypothetical protein
MEVVAERRLETHRAAMALASLNVDVDPRHTTCATIWGDDRLEEAVNFAVRS